jgi:hypothetical protein
VGLSVPEVPSGVRPISGDHLSRIPVGRAERAARKVANTAAALARRRRRDPVVLPEVAPYRKLFVVGCPRSGTSWVQGILAAHPDVITSQESHAYENVFDPITAAGAHDLRAWTKIVHRHDMGEREGRWVGLHWWVNRRQLLDLVEWALHAPGSAAEVSERVIQAIFDHLVASRSATASTVLLEKTPSHLAHGERILRRYPEARIVEVVRDGRDVCVSMEMQALTLPWPPRTRRAQIETWVRALERGDALRSGPFADRVLRVRYEDLKADTLAGTRQLFAFAGLAADDAFVAEVADRADFRHHRATGAGRHTRRGEVGDWRNHFSADDERLFRDLAGAVFEAAGYGGADDDRDVPPASS